MTPSEAYNRIEARFAREGGAFSFDSAMITAEEWAAIKGDMYSLCGPTLIIHNSKPQPDDHFDAAYTTFPPQTTCIGNGGES